MSTIKTLLRSFTLCTALLAGLLLLTGCESFVDIDSPDAQLDAATVYQETGTADAAMVNIYAKLRSSVLATGDVQGISILLGNAADELVCYNSFQAEEMFFQNNLVATNPTVATLWNDCYNLIYAANAVLEGVRNSTGIPQPDKDRLTGEALFVRAYIHFYLLNLFGEVPYVTVTDYLQNSTIGKIGSAEMYPLLIADLESAANLLPMPYANSERVRPNSAAATALLARICLYSENWAMAAQHATSVINDTSLYTWVEDLESVFLKGSTGTIWQLMPPVQGMPTLEGQNFIVTVTPPPSRALSPQLIAAFEPGDLRRVHWLGDITDGSSGWSFPYKYKQQLNASTTAEYSILLRLEELYLIRAEAENKMQDTEHAREDLNKIRNRAGLADTPAMTQQELTAAIQHERQVELFTEQGHRWFDLKRTGQADTALGTLKPGWNATDILWPLPQAELLLNPNISPQNPGY